LRKEILFDLRWTGNNGIGRYSRELSQIDVDFEIRFLTGSNPVSLKGFMKSLFKCRKNTVFYSPGFIALPSKCLQILTLHDLIHLKPGNSGFLKRKYFELILKPLIRKKRVKVITVSEQSRYDIAQWSNIEIDDIYYISNGLSKEFLISRQNVYSMVRDKNSILYVGNDKKHKNFYLFYQTAMELGPHWKVRIVGITDVGIQTSSPKNFEYFNGLSDREIADIYLTSQFLFVTSEFEGFCMPALEAAFLGVRVVHLGCLPTLQEILGPHQYVPDDITSPKTISNWFERNSQIGLSLNSKLQNDLAHRFCWEKSRLELIELLEKHIND